MTVRALTGCSRTAKRIESPAPSVKLLSSMLSCGDSSSSSMVPVALTVAPPPASSAVAGPLSVTVNNSSGSSRLSSYTTTAIVWGAVVPAGNRSVPVPDW